jgi:hypothetical protein
MLHPEQDKHYHNRLHNIKRLGDKQFVEKLALLIITCIIVIGVCSWVFLGNNGVNKGVQDGYERMKTQARSYGYRPGP